MKQWEYQYVVVPDSEYDHPLPHLNRAGARGWEFTGITRDGGDSTQYLMKREMQPELHFRVRDEVKPEKPPGDDPRAGHLV